MTELALTRRAAVPTRARCGLDAGALGALYREFAPMVLRALRRFGVELAGLDDCAHEVFLIAGQRIPQGPGVSASSWLYGTARRVASHHRRARTRSEAREQASTAPSAAPCPERSADVRETLEFVDRFVADLDERYQAVFMLSEVERMTAPEIAEALGLKVNTVYTRVARVRQAFVAAVARRDRGGVS